MPFKKTFLKYVFRGVVLCLVTAVFVVAYVYYARPDLVVKFWVQKQRNSAGLVCKSVQVGEWELPYIEGGTQHRETVVILHGFADSKDHFIPLAKELTKIYHVLAPDLPGNGETDIRIDHSYDMQFYINTIVGFLDELDVEDCHFVGYSLGGIQSALVAGEYPHRVKSLALLAPAGLHGDTPSELDKAILNNGTHPMIFEDRDGLERGLTMVFNKIPEFPDVAMRAMVKAGQERKSLYLKIINELLENTDLDDGVTSISAITAPTLIIWGEKDRVCHVSAAERWKELNAEFQVEVLPEVGHGLVLQRQNKIYNLIVEHFAAKAE